jgi:hypothetical protein
MRNRDEVFCMRCFSSPEELPAGMTEIRHGTCPWCGARNQALYPMHLIADQFREIADLYVDAKSFDDEPNDPLYKQFQQDWSLFDDHFSTTELFPIFINTLLLSGLENDEAYEERDAHTLVKPIEYCLLDEFREAVGDCLFSGKFWEHFRFPGGPPVSWYDAFLEDMANVLSKDQSLFRARIWDRNIDQERFNACDMGAPPIEKVSPGRSNRKCQKTLYCAIDQDTCIAEVRPFKGAGVAVSRITLSRDVRVIDFASELPVLHPLRVENIGWHVQLRPLLEHISYLFSLPANPNASELYYAPTQSLCDSLRDAGYDGIRYRSSLNEGGINFAFFDPDIGKPDEPEYYRIDDISVTYSDYQFYEDEHPYAYKYWRKQR